MNTKTRLGVRSPLSESRTVRLDPDLYDLLNKAKLQLAVKLGRHVSFSEIIREQLKERRELEKGDNDGTPG